MHSLCILAKVLVVWGCVAGVGFWCAFGLAPNRVFLVNWDQKSVGYTKYR